LNLLNALNEKTLFHWLDEILSNLKYKIRSPAISLTKNGVLNVYCVHVCTCTGCVSIFTASIENL